MQSSDANRYRMLAEEARRGAADMRDDDAKQMMLRIAREYEELAIRAEWLISDRYSNTVQFTENLTKVRYVDVCLEARYCQIRSYGWLCGGLRLSDTSLFRVRDG